MYFLCLTCQCYTMQHALSLLISVLVHLQKCQKQFVGSCLPSRSLSSTFWLKDEYILLLHAYLHSWSSSVSHLSQISLTFCIDLKVCPVFPMAQTLFPLPVCSSACCSQHCSNLSVFRKPCFVNLYFHGTLKPVICI